ncbi:MAG: hypothetical protein MHM6MM_002889 [Cercozoa sp. M6MM]
MFGHDDRRSPWHRRSICERMWRRREVRIGTLIFSIVFLLYLLSSSSQNAPKLIERDQREPSYDPGHDNSHFADRPGAVADADFADDGGVTQEDGVTAAEDGATGEEDGVLGEVPAVLTRDKVVLVTGAAGFIGMSTAYALSKRSDVKRVVGVDNFNAYYSPALKMARADHLRQHTGAEVVNGDVCDQSLMTDLLVSYGVTHVVHLAAQAGVRYSTQNPASYVRANVDCFVTLLDAIAAVTTSARKQEEIAAAPIRLVYASSSSVYGGNKKVPFAESDLVNRPVSLYAASKKADELIAHTYSHLHDICMIGLRFFTVYGPWGRPDMAVLKFAALMSQDKFSDSNAAEFASSCVDVLNLGDSTPVSLMDFVRTLEDVMDTTARIEYKPAAPGDVKRTHASIARSRRYHYLVRLPYTATMYDYDVLLSYYPCTTPILGLPTIHVLFYYPCITLLPCTTTHVLLLMYHRLLTRLSLYSTLRVVCLNTQCAGLPAHDAAACRFGALLAVVPATLSSRVPVDHDAADTRARGTSNASEQADHCVPLWFR